MQLGTSPQKSSRLSKLLPPTVCNMVEKKPQKVLLNLTHIRGLLPAVASGEPRSSLLSSYACMFMCMASPGHSQRREFCEMQLLASPMQTEMPVKWHYERWPLWFNSSAHRPCAHQKVVAPITAVDEVDSSCTHFYTELQKLVRGGTYRAACGMRFPVTAELISLLTATLHWVHESHAYVLRTHAWKETGLYRPGKMRQSHTVRFHTCQTCHKSKWCQWNQIFPGATKPHSNSPKTNIPLKMTNTPQSAKRKLFSLSTR